MSKSKSAPAASDAQAFRSARLQRKALVARKAVRETYRSFARLDGGNSITSALLTVAWAILMDGSFDGDGR